MLEILHIILKLFVSLVSIIAMVRILGRKVLKSDTPQDYCMMVILGGIVAFFSLTSRFNSLELISVIFIWGLMIYLLDYLKQKSSCFKKLIQGTPTVIINQGEIIEEVMEREHLTEEELQIALRAKGVFDPKDVEIGVLEINGSISVSKKKQDLIDHQKQKV